MLFFSCLAHTLIYGWAHAQTHLQHLHKHTQLHTHIVNAHVPVHYCYWTTGCWMVNGRACIEERTVVKPALNCFLYYESKINSKTHYLYGWFKGTLWKERWVFTPYLILNSLCLLIHAFAFCACGMCVREIGRNLDRILYIYIDFQGADSFKEALHRFDIWKTS